MTNITGGASVGGLRDNIQSWKKPRVSSSYEDGGTTSHLCDLNAYRQDPDPERLRELRMYHEPKKGGSTQAE